MPVSFLAVALVPLLLLVLGDAAAAADRVRLLEGLRLEQGAASTDLHITFSSAIRYVRHAPHVPSAALRIQVSPAAGPPWDAARSEETLQPEDGQPGPLQLVRVAFEPGGATVEVRFTRPVAFEVSPGRDLRSLVLRLGEPPEKERPPARAVPAPTGSPDDQRAAELLAVGRSAFTEGDFGRAALIFGEASRLPENAHSAEALELLGLARERTGQLAHAKAEYEEYLRRYPEGRDADRVRQRLAALATSRGTARAPRRAPPESRPRVDFQAFGSLYASYRREELFMDGSSETVDNSLLTDVHLDARLRHNGTTLRGQLAASYWHGFLEHRSKGKARIYAGFLETSKDGLTASVGRRTASDRGVIGRYDGAQVSYRFGERWEVGAVAGFPRNVPTVNDFETDRYFAGLSGALDRIFDTVDANLFVIAQRNEGMTDRVALGGEVRYFAEGRTIAAFFDFDLYFQSVNVAQLLGSWQVTPRSFLSATVDHRNVPILTLDSARIGQPVGSLDALSRLFSESEIKDLAEDRTSKATTVTLNGAYQLTPLVQLSGDIAGAYMSGTSSSGGVDGFGSTGIDMSYVARLTVNEMFKPGDVAVVMLRYFDSDDSDRIAASLDAHYPLTPYLRLNPRLWAAYRMTESGADSVRLRPSMRCDWRIFGFQLESEVGFEWFEPMGGFDQTQLGYFLMLGARYDF